MSDCIDRDCPECYPASPDLSGGADHVKAFLDWCHENGHSPKDEWYQDLYCREVCPEHRGADSSEPEAPPQPVCGRCGAPFTDATQPHVCYVPPVGAGSPDREALRERAEDKAFDLLTEFDVGCGPWCNDKRRVCQGIRKAAARIATDAVLSVMDEEVAALRAENERLRQGLWDIYAALGYDTDGDPTPRAVQGDLAAMVLDAAREHRRDSDEGYAGVCAERDALKAALGRVWALCDEAQKRPRIDVLIHPRDLRAAIDAPEGASPSCTCGYGGVHEELNPRCERNIAALDTPEGENDE